MIYRALIVIAVITGTFLLAVGARAETCIASVYGNGDGYAWKKTASGEQMNPGLMIAAHRTLPFGTMVRVTSLTNGRSLMVRIVDRGPFIRWRCIDLSPAAARALGFSGLAKVRVE